MAAIDEVVLSVEFNQAGIEALKAAVVQHYHDECLRLGLACTREMRDAVAGAVGAALVVPAVHGPGLDVRGREAVVESVRQQYGDQAAQAEAGRLEAVAEPGLAEVERAICATLAEIGYPAGDPGRPLRLTAAARLAEEVAKASDISSDGCPAIGRPQAMHNLDWLLRNKFPPGKIDARKIARLGVRECEPADTPGLPEK